MPNTHTPSLSSYFFLNRVTSYCVQKQILAYEVTHAFRDVIFVMQISCRAQTILTEKSWKCDENTGCNDVTVGVVTNLARNDAAYFIDQSTAWQTDNRHRPHYKIWPSADWPFVRERRASEAGRRNIWCLSGPAESLSHWYRPSHAAQLMIDTSANQFCKIWRIRLSSPRHLSWSLPASLTQDCLCATCKK